MLTFASASSLLLSHISPPIPSPSANSPHQFMARPLYQTLFRTPRPSLFATRSPPTANATRLIALRSNSSRSDNSNAFDSDTEPREALVVQKLEDAIHRIIVKRSAPDWLPFFPGSSYWVPPRRGSYGISQLVSKLSNELTDEEVMSLTSARGWPSSAFYVNDASPDPAGAIVSVKSVDSEDEES